MDKLSSSCHRVEFKSFNIPGKRREIMPPPFLDVYARTLLQRGKAMSAEKGYVLQMDLRHFFGSDREYRRFLRMMKQKELERRRRTK